MKYPRKLFTILCLSCTAVLSPGLAQAEDIPLAIQAWFDSVERQMNVKPIYDSVETDGDGSVTITNLSVSKAKSDKDPGMSLKIATAEFSGISEAGNGLYEIGSASFSNMTADIGDAGMTFKLTAPESSVEGWFVQDAGGNASPELRARAMMTVARKMTMGQATLEAQGQTFSVDGYESTWDGDPKTGAGTFESRVTNIAIPESAIALADQGGMLKQLGYTSLSFDLAGKGKTEIADGKMSLTFDGAVSGRDMAAIRIGFSAADVPLAVMAEFQKAQTTGAEPDFNALLPQIQGISVSNLSVRFEDASLTGKLLPMLAAMQGMDEKTMLASAGPMLQMGLMQLQNQAFAEQASKAVNAFLNDPKSITIAAKPAAPVKVSEMMTLNPNAPGEAITRLGISVSAND